MAAGGGGDSWKKMLGFGGALVALGMGLEHGHVGPHWLVGALLAFGGLGVVFGACECMILSVEGIGKRLGWSPFVAGTMAGLASNLPEIVMIGFIVAANPRLAFIMTALTLQVGVLAFGAYCVVLPKGPAGEAKMPDPLVKLSTDLYACAGTMFLTIGAMMLMMKEFVPGKIGLNALDMYVIGGSLILVEVVAIVRLVKRFSGGGGEVEAAEADGKKLTRKEQRALKRAEKEAARAAEEAGGDSSSTGSIAFFGLVGMVASVIGGHAVGDFAEMLVAGLEAAGYSEMVGATVLSFFACAGVLVMIVSTHSKGLYDLAIANVSGAVTQVPFVVLPVVMLTHAVFAQTGVVPMAAPGVVLEIDLETTSVVLLSFPPMLILWKSIQDDGKVNHVETAGMCAVFVLTIYMLAAHG